MATSEETSTQSGRIAGRSHRAGDATDETKQIVINTILKKADEYGLSAKDKANLVAFAKIESGFNPDAASLTSTASGVMQIVDQTADDAIKRLSGSKIIGGHHLGVYKRFNIDSNIEYGIAIYLDKKRKVRHSDDAAILYKEYNHKRAEYTKHLESIKADSKNSRKKFPVRAV